MVRREWFMVNEANLPHRVILSASQSLFSPAYFSVHIGITHTLITKYEP